MADKRRPTELAHCAEMLSALAAPERLRILQLLAGGEQNVTQIIDRAGITPPNVSHHLSVLKQVGLIRAEKRGRFVYYSITPEVRAEVTTAGLSKEALDLGCCQLVLPEEQL